MDAEFLRATYDTALNFGLPIMSADTAARILATTYVHGNNEFMCHSDKFMVEIGYIQKRFGINGGERPDPQIVKLIQHYVKELKDYDKAHPKDRYPGWAAELFKKRYGFKLIN